MSTMSQSNKQAVDFTREHSRQLMEDLQQLLERWIDRGHCLHCLAGHLLLHAGSFAALELEPDDMCSALEVISSLSEEHCATQGAGRH
jgi:hypothetical protein